jgi:hypothetical protein
MPNSAAKNSVLEFSWKKVRISFKADVMTNEIKFEIKSPSKEFKIYLESINLAFRQFCFLEKILENLSKPPLNEDYFFWKVVQIGLLRSYLLELSKIFEKQDNQFDPVLSIYYLMDFEFKDYKDTLSKIKKLRNKFLVHTDLKTSLDIEQFIKKISLTPKEIDRLFKKTYEVAEKIIENQGLLKKGISSSYSELKISTSKEFEKLIVRLKKYSKSD